MNVLIVTDQRFVLKDGKFYTEKVFYNNLKRYKKQFGNISIYAKTGNAVFKSATEIKELDIYLGGNNLNLYLGKNMRTFKKIIPKFDLIILRVPSVLANQAAKVALKENIPYMTVAVGCAFDALWNHGLIGKLLAPIMFKRMQSVVKNASYASYVTNKFLQKRYPCNIKSVAVSDVTINTSDRSVLQNRLQKIDKMDTSYIKIMTAAALNVRYKGQQYVIKAIPILNRLGINVKYYIAGTGDVKYLRSVAEKYGVSDQVIDLGAVSHDEILRLLDEIDLYIQPSLQEGLPRAVVEALSRGCPCIGTEVGGIPELIPKECIVAQKSPKDIAKKVYSIIDKNKLKELAQENWAKSNLYSNDILSTKRTKYFQYVIDDITYS